MNLDNIINTCIIEYLQDISNITDKNFLESKDGSMLFFRTFYIYYITCKYVDKKIPSKENFMYYLNKSFETIDKTINTNLIRDMFYTHYDYLHKVFFIDDNIYFGNYFNNLIKYFMPLPYECLLWCPIITYRSNVTSCYKMNNIDYLEKPTSIEFIRSKSYVRKKNIDMIVNEIDIHIPIKYFDCKLFNDNIFLIAIKHYDKYKLVIAKNAKLDKNILSFKCIYKRNYSYINKNLFTHGIAFQFLFEKWIKLNNDEQTSMQNIIYISVMRKITSEDLFNVFPKVNIRYRFVFESCCLYFLPRRQWRTD